MSPSHTLTCLLLCQLVAELRAAHAAHAAGNSTHGLDMDNSIVDCMGKVGARGDDLCPGVKLV